VEIIYEEDEETADNVTTWIEVALKESKRQLNREQIEGFCLSLLPEGVVRQEDGLRFNGSPEQAEKALTSAGFEDIVLTEGNESDDQADEQDILSESEEEPATAEELDVDEDEKGKRKHSKSKSHPETATSHQNGTAAALAAWEPEEGTSPLKRSKVMVAEGGEEGAPALN